MSSGLDELTVHAHQLVSDGDLHGARRVLTDALADADPHPANASPDLADAAGLLARILVALGEPQIARGWAAYTYAATTRLYGRSDPQTVSAAATLAAVLHRVGSDARAARLYSDVIIELTATDGPESLRVLAAHADLATVEYARGQCAVARDRLLDAWELHREVYGDGHPGGIKMLARLGAMQRDCGRYADAHRNLTYADELCRRYLAFDDPLAAQVAALGRASANPAHVCADDEEPPAVPPAPPAPSEDGPPGMTEGPAGVPSARTALPEEGPPEAYTRPAWSESTSYIPPALPEPTPYEPPGATEPVAYDPSTSPPPPYDPPAWSQPYPPTGSTGTVPAPRSPTDDDHGWPPADTFPAPADTFPAPTSTAHRGRGGPEAPGVHRVRRSPAPEAPSRLLPVPVHRAPAQPRPNRLVPMVAAGVVVVVLGAAAVIAGVARVDGSRNDPPAPPVGTPTSSGTTDDGPGAGEPADPPASPGTPPAGLKLRDTRDTVVLSWRYPVGAEGPVVVSGSRTGEEPRAFTELPAGSGTYTVHGLDRDVDFCFTVAVVWSTDSVGRSRQVCTDRR